MLPILDTESTVNHLAAKVNHSSFALITAGQGDARRYLLQWNSNWGVFNLIGGKVDNRRGDAGSFLNAIQRELEEEMGIVYPQDYVIVQEFKHIYLSQYSQQHRTFKNYHFCVFAIDIFPDLQTSNIEFALWLSTGRHNIYTSKEEIFQLRTYQNSPISRTTKLILQELGCLQAYVH
jgi:8-oxo-dGTP pyrophosphatase MutT (NUDIX family)